MENRIYDKPKLKQISLEYSSPFCLSPNDGDAGGRGEDFEWGN